MWKEKNYSISEHIKKIGWFSNLYKHKTKQMIEQQQLQLEDSAKINCDNNLWWCKFTILIMCKSDVKLNREKKTVNMK